MSAKSFSKPRLSKGILEMKFMQRTKAKVDKEIEDAEGRAMYSNEITQRMLNSNSNFIIEPSFVHCENLIEGRLSFRGMNPEIERLLELEREEKAASKRQEQSADVSIEDMAKFYHNNKKTGADLIMEKKFSKFKKINQQNNSSNSNNKRSSSEGIVGGKNKKQKFMKPKDDDDVDDE